MYNIRTFKRDITLVVRTFILGRLLFASSKTVVIRMRQLLYRSHNGKMQSSIPIGLLWCDEIKTVIVIKILLRKVCGFDS